MDYHVVAEQIEEDLNGWKHSEIIAMLERQSKRIQISNYTVKSVNLYATTGFLIYEKIDSTLYINISVSAELEIQYEYHDEFWNPGLKYFERFDYSDSEYIDIETYVPLIVKDGEVADTSILGDYN